MVFSFRKFLIIISLSGVAAAGSAQTFPVKQSDEVVLGAARVEVYKPMLEGKKVALLINHTSVVDGLSLVDFMVASDINVVKIFAPEHGFRGTADAGEKVDDGVDEATGLPVISLYGSHKKPTAADLAGVDILVFDIQDVGARFYTYISTMSLAMEACAEQSIGMVVLDRPNPNGFYVDGPILRSEQSSFVGMHPVPVVHGMTVGEYAQMVNAEGWLAAGVKCELTVVACERYTHRDRYVLPIPPSPNLPNQNAIYLYPSLCFFEGTTFSVGRGTEAPFQMFGHPDLSIASFVFVPKSMPGARAPKHEGIPCLGWNLSEIGGARIVEKRMLILDWLVNAYRAFPNKDKFFLENGFFDLLAGTPDLRAQIEAGKTADEIRMSWSADVEKFMTMRSKYLLYQDF